MFERLGLSMYRIRFSDQITDTSHETIVPNSMKINTNARDAAAAVKPALPLFSPWYRRQEVFVALRSFEPSEWTDLTKSFGPGEKNYK